MPVIGSADADLIKAALEVIPAEDYQTWFEVGCALHFEFGDAGFELFDRWSATSFKYNANECQEKWRECQKICTYTIGTIIHYANEAQPGWREAYEIVSWRKLVARMKAARGLRHG